MLSFRVNFFPHTIHNPLLLGNYQFVSSTKPRSVQPKSLVITTLGEKYHNSYSRKHCKLNSPRISFSLPPLLVCFAKRNPQQNKSDESDSENDFDEDELLADLEDVEFSSYTSYIDPITGEKSPIFGERSSISKRMAEAANSKEMFEAPDGTPKVRIESSKSRNLPEAHKAIEEEEENIYEEEEENIYEEEEDYNSKEIEEIEEEKSKAEAQETPAESILVTADVSSAGLTTQTRPPPIRKSKWTPRLKDDGLLPGIRQSNAIIKAMWAEVGPRGDPFVKEADLGEVARRSHTPEKHLPTAEAALLSAAAEMGQIRLFGDIPSVTESELARARKFVLREERLEMEETLKSRVGPIAYYRQFVHGWTEDVSQEAVRRREEEDEMPVHLQLVEMLQRQTLSEYRTMMGTDMRVRRDPLLYRMTDEQVKKVWGGDPVFPTIQYEQSKENINYRSQNFHDPTKDPFDYVIEMGRAISSEDIQKILAKEREEEMAMLAAGEDDVDSLDISEGIEDEDEDEVTLLDEEEDDDEEEEEEEREGVVEDTVIGASPRTKIVGALGGKDGVPNIKAMGDVVARKEGEAGEEDDDEEEGEDEDEDNDWFSDFQDFVKKTEASKGAIASSTSIEPSIESKETNLGDEVEDIEADETNI